MAFISSTLSSSPAFTELRLDKIYNFRKTSVPAQSHSLIRVQQSVRRISQILKLR